MRGLARNGAVLAILGLISSSAPASASQQIGQVATNPPGDLAAAALDPVNTFSFGAVRKNKKTGTATLEVNVPGPGELFVTGNGIKASAAKLVAQIDPLEPVVKLRLRARGKKRTELDRTGSVKLAPKVTYIPTGGTASTQTRKLTLRKRR